MNQLEKVAYTLSVIVEVVAIYLVIDGNVLGERTIRIASFMVIIGLGCIVTLNDRRRKRIAEERLAQATR